MNDDQLQFDRTCHVIYSKPCKAEIREKIAHHYPESQREAVWERVQMQYVDFLSDWRTDLGGEKNFHNGPGGNYDCIALMAYYVVCRDVTSLQEIEEMEGNLFLPSFRKLSKLKFIDINKPLCKKLLHRAFLNAKKQCDKWGDFEMHVAPFDKDQPIYYEFTACPTAEFAKKHDLLEVMPALCNPDFAGMELIHARLIRKRPVRTAANATTRSAATRTLIAESIPSTATSRATAGTNRNQRGENKNGTRKPSAFAFRFCAY